MAERKPEGDRPADWKRLYPSLELPRGLEFEDPREAARHLDEWEGSTDLSGVEVVAIIYRELAAKAAAAERK